MANINIVATNGEHIPVLVLVIDQIPTPPQNRFWQQVRTIQLPHIRGLQLAHPVMSDENFEILVLISVDHYWDIVKNTVSRGQGPTAVESKLSYLISGPLQTGCVNHTDTVMNLLQTLTSTKAPERYLEHFWSLESIGISPPTEWMTRNPSCNTSRYPPLQECLMAVTAPNFKIVPHYLPTIVAVHAAPGLWYAALLIRLAFLDRTGK